MNSYKTCLHNDKNWFVLNFVLESRAFGGVSAYDSVEGLCTVMATSLCNLYSTEMYVFSWSLLSGRNLD